MRTLYYASRAEMPATDRFYRILIWGLAINAAAFGLCAFVLNLPPNQRTLNPRVARASVGPNGALSQAIDLFHLDTGHWPATLSQLIERPAEHALRNKWSGPYLHDPDGLLDPWNRPYRYAAPAADQPKLTKANLWSVGEDGVDGTSDDVHSP